MFIFLMFFISNVHAGELNCRGLYKAGYPDPRFPEGMNCILAKNEMVGTTPFQSFHYTEGFPLVPDDEKFQDTAFEVFNDVLNKLEELKPTLSKKLSINGLTFILSNHDPVSTEVAKVKIGHAAEGENCPIVVYSKAFNKNSISRKKQMLAHEIFHCVQDKIWREKKLGVDNKIDAWWIEGSAVWFSNLIYPSANQESDYNFDYQGELSLVSQENPYSTHAFFQSLSQSWLGIDHVISYFNSMPDSGGSDDQLRAALRLPSLSLHFHRFAEQLLGNKILDFDSSFMTTNLASDPVRHKVLEGSNSLSWELDPLLISLHEIELPAKSIISLDNTSVDDDGDLSYRTSSASDWEGFYKGYPVTVDLSCKAHTRSIEILSTHASNKDKRKFSFEVNSKKSECKCIDKEKFDPCLYGNYQIDSKSIDEMFKKIFKGKYTVEKSEGDYGLSIDHLQQLSFDLKSFKVSVIIHDEVFGDLKASVTSTGKTQAIGKLPEKQTLCFSDISDDIMFKVSIEMPFGTVESAIPYNHFEDLAIGTLKYQCSASELVLIRELPTGSDGSMEAHPIRFKRK